MTGGLDGRVIPVHAYPALIDYDFGLAHPARTSGVTVARAKRTARADARRRYRAEHQVLEDEAEDLDRTASSDSGAARSSSAGAKSAPAPAQRMSIGAAFRQSFRPLDARGDLVALPWIATRTKALWLPLLLVIGSTVAFAITLGSDLVTQFMFMYFVQTPAIGGVFIAGFMAPRASWLLGLIVGLVSAICYSALILGYSGAVADAAGEQAAAQGAQDAITAAFLLSPTMGIFFAAAAAWYRRFLNLSNPNRARREQERKAAQRPDGRSRSSGAQKAGR